MIGPSSPAEATVTRYRSGATVTRTRGTGEVRRASAGLLLAATSLAPSPSMAAAVECSVNVLTAYQTAVKRG